MFYRYFELAELIEHPYQRVHHPVGLDFLDSIVFIRHSTEGRDTEEFIIVVRVVGITVFWRERFILLACPFLSKVSEITFIPFVAQSL